MNNLRSVTLLSSLLFFTLFNTVTAIEIAPGFSGKTLSGSTINFPNQHSEKATLLVFWASWCVYCVAEMPKLKTLNTRFSSTLQILGVNVNKHVEDGLKTVQQYKLPYPSLADPDLRIADQFNVRGTPVLIVIDKQGRMVKRSHRLDKSLIKAIEKVSL